MEERLNKNDDVLKALEALKRASKEVQTAAAADSGDGGCSSPSMKALLELETSADDLFSGDPLLSPLRRLLSQLRSLVLSLPSPPAPTKPFSLLINSLLRRPRSPHHALISQVAGAISGEIQSWIDRETLDRLIHSLQTQLSDGERVTFLLALETRAADGFDRSFQENLLRSGAFSVIESTLADPAQSKQVRDRCASSVLALVRFNKDVFVGPVLMGPTVSSLIEIASPASIRALNGLISAIRSPLIDELHSYNQLPRLVSLLSSPDLEVRILALEFALGIGYYGRREAVDSMLAEGLIKRLLCLQRSDLGGALIEMDGLDGSDFLIEKGTDWIFVGNVWKGRRRGSKQERFLEARPFASAVARFATHVEVGEGLRQREKREIKQEILKRVREAVNSPAEAGTVLAEVLWGSTP